MNKKLQAQFLYMYIRSLPTSHFADIFHQDQYIYISRFSKRFCANEKKEVYGRRKKPRTWTITEYLHLRNPDVHYSLYKIYYTIK